VLAFHVLDIPYHPGLMIWLAGIGGGASVVTLAGWLATQKITRVPPLVILRE